MLARPARVVVEIVGWAPLCTHHHFLPRLPEIGLHPHTPAEDHVIARVTVTDQSRRCCGVAIVVRLAHGSERLFHHGTRGP